MDKRTELIRQVFGLKVMDQGGESTASLRRAVLERLDEAHGIAVVHRTNAAELRRILAILGAAVDAIRGPRPAPPEDNELRWWPLWGLLPNDGGAPCLGDLPDHILTVEPDQAGLALALALSSSGAVDDKATRDSILGEGL